MPNYKIILNPTADRGNSVKQVPQIDRLLREEGLTFDIAHTGYPWHAAELTWQAVADGYDVVVAAGGDGTCNEVLNGLMLAQQSGLGKAHMGVLPIGRGNDFAFSMGIPEDLDESCKALATGQACPIDIGQVIGELYPEGRFFGNGVGIGFDAVVGFVAARNHVLHGFMSYLWAAMKTIFLYYKAPTLQVELDDETITLPALMVSVMNGRRMGGTFMMAPDSSPSDGLFTLCMVWQVTRQQIFSLIPQFMKGTQFSHPAVKAKKSAHLVISAVEGTIPAHADGETICVEGQKVRIELHPAALNLILPLSEKKEADFE